MTTISRIHGLSLVLSLGLLPIGGCAGEVSALEEACVAADCEGPTHDQMLEGLGVDLQPDPPLDPNGEPLPEDSNPFGSPNTSLFTFDELFFAGISVPSLTEREARVGLVDDELNAGGMLFEATDDSWSQSPTKAVAIDLDGDGIEEIVVVSLTQSAVTGETAMRARILREEDGEMAMSEPSTLATFPASPINLDRFYNGYFQLDAVAADLDGDGADDLFVAAGKHLLQYTYEDDGFAIADERRYRDTGGDDNADVYVRLAAGDLELNGRDELVIVSSSLFTSTPSVAQFQIVGDDLDGELASGSVLKTEGGSLLLRTARPEIADLDGDGVPEIVFAGRSKSTELDGLGVLVMTGSKHPTPYRFTDLSWSDETQGQAMYPLVAADLLGNRRDQILAGHTILQLAPSGILAVVRDDLGVLPQTDLAVVGDRIGDRREDIVFLSGTFSPNTGGGDVADNFALNGFSTVHVDSSDSLQVTEVRGVGGRIDDYPTVALANVDGDSPVVRFLGRDLLFTDPTVIAAIAAPPTFAGAEQSDGATSFGRSESTDRESSYSVTLSVARSVGLETEDPSGGFGGGFELSASLSIGWSFSKTTSIERAVSFAAGPDEDKVVFAAVPYDVYVYEVVSSPDPEAVGTHVTVSVPREPQVLSTSLAFYNESVRGRAPAVETVFAHEVGNPFSYPTRADRDARVAAGGALYSDLATVGIGTGSTTVSVSRSESVGYGVSLDLEQTVQLTVKAAFATASQTWARNIGVGLTISNTTGASYEGTVGDIPAERVDEVGLYQFGLLAYPESIGGRPMMVVSYWVEE